LYQASQGSQRLEWGVIRVENELLLNSCWKDFLTLHISASQLSAMIGASLPLQVCQ
jgi:hypothetical protein